MKFSPNQRQALEFVAAGRFYPGLVREDDGWHARWFPYAVGPSPDANVVRWVDEYVRAAAMTPLTADAENQRHLTLHDAWIAALRSRTGLVVGNDAACAAFAKTLVEWSDAESFSARGGIVFRLVAEGKRLFVSCVVPNGRAALKALGEAVYAWGKLRELRMRRETRAESRELRVELTKNEAEDFARRGAAALKADGYGAECGTFVVRVSASAEIKESGSGPTTSASGVNLTVKLDGRPVSAEEIRFLLEQKSNFVYFRDHWIEIDRVVLREALKALEKVKRTNVNPVAFALGIGAIGRLEIDEAKVGGVIARMIDDVRRSVTDDIRVRTFASQMGLDDLNCELRDYQRRGVRWLRAVTDRGFGALLADDMGLGKTVQAIAWILSVFTSPAPVSTPVHTPAFTSIPVTTPTPIHSSSPNFLVVAPLTLLANWKREFEKFAPSLKVYMHQGDGRHVASGFRMACAGADVTITSYNLLVRDHLMFAEVAWDGLVLDEAQTIKNFDTHTARAVRALMPRYRVALTGTPIENSVMDVWSIEEFLNPGFLGECKSFEERFVKPLGLDPMCRAGKRLRKALEPFVLRRLKSDPGIAAELGGKVEIREYCRLTDAQRTDYERALGDYRMSVRRQGDVFALITALKLICDGTGKLERLVELLSQIFAAGESALVFTQYAKVGAWLKREIDRRFQSDLPFLHGGLSAREREREIEKFNTSGIAASGFSSSSTPQRLTIPPFKLPNAFILSLRAGGFGLNLTKATHVIHFDRWWNPAVEGQATDRAHRIGQERDVFVHDFITVGTLEEHIDDILAKKQTLEGLLKDGEELWKAVKLG